MVKQQTCFENLLTIYEYKPSESNQKSLVFRIPMVFKGKLTRIYLLETLFKTSDRLRVQTIGIRSEVFSVSHSDGFQR